METVNDDHIARTTNTAVPIPIQSADAPAPAPAPPTHNTHHQATVEDATARPPTNFASISDTTPQRSRHQEDAVDEGGRMEGKSNSHILNFFN